MSWTESLLNSLPFLLFVGGVTAWLIVAGCLIWGCIVMERWWTRVPMVVLTVIYFWLSITTFAWWMCNNDPRAMCY